ncbi:lysine--tRNA ligase, partial [uncultured Veillonella sp.]|uniref:lysine--tRNA ligase n=1 Tax=uncultured Veillonella sp. TaxID=159268 RepID=UPI0026199966
MNPKVRDVFKKRAHIIACIRDWLLKRNFMEVETPMMQNLYGGAVARPFITHHNAHDMDVYLRISPELYLKRLIVGGFDRVFEINRNFRNEGIDKSHYPEFTMVETYQAYADYNDMIKQIEDLVCYCAEQVTGSTKVMYQGVEIDFKEPWQRMTMVEAIKKYSGEDFDEVETLDDAQQLADRLGAEYSDHDGIGKVMNACFEKVAEGQLIQPTIITGHPLEISPLAKQSREKPWLTDRFEAYIFGRELANGFSELNDPFDQRTRFEQQMRERELGDESAHQMDEDFIDALEYGLPPTAGLGIGIDRLVMFLTDSPSIRDVIFFPLMKPEEGRERGE